MYQIALFRKEGGWVYIVWVVILRGLLYMVMTMEQGMKSVGEVKDVAGPETIGMGYIEQADSVVVCHGNGEVKVRGVIRM